MGKEENKIKEKILRRKQLERAKELNAKSNNRITQFTTPCKEKNGEFIFHVLRPCLKTVLYA
jgi:hypothetical protein